MNWKEKTKKEKTLFIIKAIIWTLAATLVVLAVFSKEIFGAGSAFGGLFGGSDSEITFATWIDKQIPILIKSIVSIIITLAISRLLRFIIEKILLVTKKGQTATKLIDSFIRYLTAIVVILIALLVFGVDPVALLASVGVLGLIIGLGAQSLISDIISGIFIVFEGEYQIGDWIVIEGFRGKVESIGIRTTQFVDVGGNIKIINNSEIKTVVNLSYSDSLVVAEVTVKHDDFKRAEQVINDNLEKIKEAFPHFSNGPRYIGVADFTKEGVLLKFVGKVEESKRFQSERDLRRAIKILFDENNIPIALPKVYVENIEGKVIETQETKK